jgi:hypothetical protein
MKIEEVFIVNVDKLVEEFGKLLDVTKPASGSQSEEDESKLLVLQDPEYRRLKSRVDLGLALRLYNRKWCVTMYKQRTSQTNWSHNLCITGMTKMIYL